jgi:hypothetical protein
VIPDGVSHRGTRIPTALKALLAALVLPAALLAEVDLASAAEANV